MSYFRGLAVGQNKSTLHYCLVCCSHASLETFILRVGFISFDVGQIIVDNGDIAQNTYSNITIENFVPRG